MTKRSTWEEAHLRDSDHVARVVVELVREECEFDIRPEPDGWWRLRADLPDRQGQMERDRLHAIVQSTRFTVAA